MLTGQFSSHALHVVQAQISSLVMRSKTLFGATRMLPGSLARAISLSTPIGGVTWGGAGTGHYLAGFEHDFAGIE